MPLSSPLQMKHCHSNFLCTLCLNTAYLHMYFNLQNILQSSNKCNGDSDSGSSFITTLPLGSHLVVEEHVDDGVDNGAELGQDGGHHTRHGSDQSRPTEGGHQRHDAVGHPAQHVAGHHGQHHHQNVLLSALSCQQIDFTHLDT